MSVKMVGSEQLAKLPVSDAGSALDDEGGEGSAKFGDLLSSLASGKNGAPADEGGKGKGQGKGSVVGTLAALAAAGSQSEGVPAEGLETFLKSVLNGSAADASATGTQAVQVANGADTSKAANLEAIIATVLAGLQSGAGQAGADGVPSTEQQAVELKKLAELIVKSTQQQPNADKPLPVTDDAKPMPGVKQVLNAWTQGPHAAAAMSTGAQEKAPMDLKVTDVATHFAPVAGSKLDVPDEMRRDAKALSMLAQEMRRDTADVVSPAGGMKANVESGLSGQGGAAFSDGDKKPSSQQASTPVVTGTEEAKATAKVDPVMQDQAGASAAKQIANTVVREAKGLPQPPQVTQVPVDVKQPLGKLQVLQIQLQPESLGSVTVKMELRGDMIELRIDVMRAQTAELIQKDREVLSSILRAAGYSADDAHIRVSHADSSMSMNSSGQNGTASNQGQPQSAQQDSQAGSQSRGNRADKDAENLAETPDPNASQSRQTGDGSGIYL